MSHGSRLPLAACSLPATGNGRRSQVRRALPVAAASGKPHAAFELESGRRVETMAGNFRRARAAHLLDEDVAASLLACLLALLARRRTQSADDLLTCWLALPVCLQLYL